MKPTLLIWIFQIYSNWTFLVFLKFVYPHLRIFFHCFLGERNGEGRGREREIDWYERISWSGCLSSRPRPGRITHAENWDPTHNPCMCLDWEGRDDTLTNWATQPGPFWVFFKRFYLFIFSEREREGEREGETHQIWERNMDLLPPALPWLGTEPTAQVWALTENGTGNLLICGEHPANRATLVRAFLVFLKLCFQFS